MASETYTIRVDDAPLLECLHELKHVVASPERRFDRLVKRFEAADGWIDATSRALYAEDGTGEVLVVLKPGERLLELVAALRADREAAPARASDGSSLLDRAYEATFGTLSPEDEAWLATKPSIEEKIKRIPMFAAAAAPWSAAHAQIIIVQLQRLIELLEKRHSTPPVVASDEKVIELLERIAGRLDRWI